MLRHKNLSFFIFLSALIFSLSENAFCFNQNDVHHHTMENGLEIYFLEDVSSAVIKTELDVKAGFSRQTEKNAGFFDFYARLKGSQAGEDCVKFTKTSSPDKFEKNMLELSEILRPVQISDSELSRLLETQKTELEKYYSGAAGFINSAIDAKVFPEFPWKRASGAVPSLFDPKKFSEARSILNSIAANYYVPNNSLLFVSGNITENAVLELAKKYFGKYGPNQNLPKNEIKKSQDDKSSNSSGNSKSPKSQNSKPHQKKFVIHDKSFSPEMTQICVQYKNLDSNQAEILAEIWNDNDSVFKKTLLRQRNLKILGAEYIDASAAKSELSSRLIIQSLLGVVKVNPEIQADLFLSKSRENEEITDEMIQAAVKKRENENLRTYEDSSKTMGNLASFVLESSEEDKIAAFFSQNETLSKITAEDLRSKIQDEEPFVFVLLNSNIYQKNAKVFQNAGFKILTSKNAFYFNQDEYKNLFAKNDGSDAADANQKEKSLQEDILSSAERFIKTFESQITEFTLKNQIPLVFKKNKNTSRVQVSLIIQGGDLLFADETPGLASVLTGCIAQNVKSQLDLFAKNGAFQNDSYEIKTETFATFSSIDLILDSSDLNFGIQALYTALIFCDITPASADLVTYDERRKWRLKSGTAEFQLLCDAIRTLYDGTKYPLLFEDEKDKPEEMDFQKILSAYPALLDATRFSFIVAGGFSDEEKVLPFFDRTFGTLETNPENQIYESGLPRAQIKETELKFAIRHLFLTDIPKEKAGPEPAVLIPTTKFYDPALFCFSCPDLKSKDCALYNALLLEIAKKMDSKAQAAGRESRAKAFLPENDVPFARISVSKIERISGAEKIYKESLDELKNELKNELELKTSGVIDLEKSEILSRLENNWIMEILSGSGTNEGAAELVKSGFAQGNAKLCLDQYAAVDKAALEDYFLILESYFPETPPMRLYSKDSKN